MALNLDSAAQTVERYMLDVIRIERKTGETYNPTTQKVSEVWTTVYEGKAFGSPMGDPATTDNAGEAVLRTQYEVGIPRTAPEPKENDRIRFLVSADPTLLGETRFWVRGLVNGTFFTHRRIKASKDRPDT